MLAPDVQARFAEMIASGALPLPVLPEVASQVLALVQRPDCDTARLAELLRRDPAMTAHGMARVFAVPGFEAEVKAAFQHALATALFAQEIAKARRSTVDAAFLAGLFHD